MQKSELRDVKRAALQASQIFQGFQPSEIDEILTFAAERVVPADTVIFQRGDAGSSLIAVLSGRVRISVVSAEGKEIVLNVIGPGEVFGEIAFLDGKPRSADATAMSTTHLLTVDRRQFMPFLKRNEDITLRLLAVMCERLRRTSLALGDIALLGLPARLARVLLDMLRNYGRPVPQGARISVKCSQVELGKLVGVSRESVNKQLKQWENERIMAKDGQHMVVLRPEALRELVE